MRINPRRLAVAGILAATTLVSAGAAAPDSHAGVSVAYNNSKGGISEFQLYAGARTTATGFTESASNASLRSPAAYNGSATWFLYSWDQDGSIWGRPSHQQPGDWSNAVRSYKAPQGSKLYSAGYGKDAMLLYTQETNGTANVFHYPTQLSTRGGADAVYERYNDRVVYVGWRDGRFSEIRSVNVDGSGDRSEFTVGGRRAIRTLAASQNGGGIIASIWNPDTGRSSIYECFLGSECEGRFSYPQDYVMVAATGQFGGGARIIYETNKEIRLFDNRTSKSYVLARDARHGYVAVSPAF